MGQHPCNSYCNVFRFGIFVLYLLVLTFDWQEQKSKDVVGQRIYILEGKGTTHFDFWLKGTEAVDLEFEICLQANKGHHIKSGTSSAS